MNELQTAGLLTQPIGTIAHDARVWTRKGSGPNVVVLAGGQLFVGLMPSRQLKRVQALIASGEPIENVLGEHFVGISCAAMQSVRAEAGSSAIDIEHGPSRDSVEAVRITLADSRTQRQVLSELQSRLPWRVERDEVVSSRFYHAFRPLNFLIVCSLLAFAGRAYFKSDYARIPDQVINQKPTTGPEIRPRNPSNRRSAGDYTASIDRAVAQHRRNKQKPTGIAALFVGIMAAIGFVIQFVGEQILMSVLYGSIAACLVWAAWRVLVPPRTVTLYRAE